MEVVLHLPEITVGPDDRTDDPAFLADLYAGRIRCEVTWPELLTAAVRDGAVSVHFHPWGNNGWDILTYVVGGTRFGLVQPTDEAGDRLWAAALRLAAPGPLSRLWAWAAGCAVGRVRLVAASDESEWCVVCWRRGRLSGVEFFRLSPVPVSTSSADPDAEPPD